jgi:hypothetical protein
MPVSESNFITAFSSLVSSSDDDDDHSLESSMGSDTLDARKALLEQHLQRTGRAPTGDDDAQSDRADLYAGKVLHGMERSTQDLQRRQNRDLDKQLKLKKDEIDAKALEISQKEAQAKRKRNLREPRKPMQRSCTPSTLTCSSSWRP